MSEARATHAWVHDRRGDCAICGEGPTHENHSNAVAIAGNLMALLVERDALFVRNKKLAQWLNVILDQVDYTKDACSLTEMVGAVLDKSIIEQARAALAENKKQADE